MRLARGLELVLPWAFGEQALIGAQNSGINFGTAAIVSHGARPALANKKDSLNFAVIGDSGTGGSSQYEVARQM
ncbi:MAG TPA: hypothetical protein VFS12_09600 [Terriglobia bacterium]|nr:hypothetical protein [Terriglobia bacterium]